MRNTIILFILVTYFATSYSQCNDDKCYNHYKNLTTHETENIQEVFDGLLEKYGNVDEVLKNLLNKLNYTILKADLSLHEFEKDNNKINNTNELSNSTLPTVLEGVKLINDEINNINGSRNSWLEEITDANKTADLIISILAALEDIKTNENELEKWKNFLQDFDKDNYPKDILNIPHDVADKLILLENLLNNEGNITCFDKFHEDLKILFLGLTDILNYFNDFEEQIKNIKQKSDKNKEDADRILSKTEKFLAEEEKLKRIETLVNDLAEEVEKLTKMPDEKLKELQESHDADLKNLNDKYNANDYQSLLNELEDINIQIQEAGNGEIITMATVEGDIEKYLKDIEYYTCILEDCRYRNPAEAVTTFNCINENA